jgi:chemotaxis protein CheD
VEQAVIVGMAGCEIGEAPGGVLATYALGSCIGLAVYDPKVRVGGLLHFMLPDSGIDPGCAPENPYRFADTGIPLLLGRVVRRGASARRLIAAAAGAARMVTGGDMFDIGRRNYLAMRRALWKAGILLCGEAVGGDAPRNLRLDIGTGRLWVEERGNVRELVPGFPPKG